MTGSLASNINTSVSIQCFPFPIYLLDWCHVSLYSPVNWDLRDLFASIACQADDQKFENFIFVLFVLNTIYYFYIGIWLHRSIVSRFFGSWQLAVTIQIESIFEKRVSLWTLWALNIEHWTKNQILLWIIRIKLWYLSTDQLKGISYIFFAIFQCHFQT